MEAQLLHLVLKKQSRQCISLWCTFLHVALQDGLVSEYNSVEDSLAGAVEWTVQADITVRRSVTTVLSVYVAMDPGHEQIDPGRLAPSCTEKRKLSLSFTQNWNCGTTGTIAQKPNR